MKVRDYDRMIEQAANNLSVAMAAKESGRWEPSAMSTALLYFTTQLLIDNEFVRIDDAGDAVDQLDADQRAGDERREQS